MTLNYYSIYDRGYNSGADGRPRVLPINIAQSLPDTSQEWYQGYDAAISDPADIQEEVRATFTGNLGYPY